MIDRDVRIKTQVRNDEQNRRNGKGNDLFSAFATKPKLNNRVEFNRIERYSC